MLKSAIVVATLMLSVVEPAQARVRPRPARLELNAFGPARALTETAWLVERFGTNRRFDLGSETQLALLARYVEPSRNHTPEWQSFWHGRYGRNDFELYPELAWFGGRADEPEPALEPWLGRASLSSGFELRGPEPAEPFDLARAEVLPGWALSLAAPKPEYANVTPRKVCPRGQAPRPVSVVRYDGAEWVRQALVDCDGSIAPGALDQLSVLARPPATPRPELPLPLEPEAGAPHGEWLPRVKLLHPRVIWAVQKIAEAFPNRSIFIMSGYRPDAHGSYHQKGRALDLYVSGVDNADLFRFCRTLNDVGCGFYPNNKFVHVDVRPYGTHRVAWVDISAPGRPSQYVASWPGVLDRPISSFGSRE